MDNTAAKARIDFLTETLHYHNHLYYNENRIEVSDFEFDKMLEELNTLERQFPELKKPNSPTERVGGGITKNFETVLHQYPMLSLSNTYNKEELVEFHDRVIKNLDNDTFEYICEQKFDGVAISLIYKDGVLVRAITRGDGEKGDDVTTNVKTIKTIPIVLKSGGYPAAFEVRGEVFLPRKNFEKINEELIKQGKPSLANPRNSASGTIKMQDSKVVAARGLDCYLYSLLGENLDVKSHEEALQKMKSWGFNISPTWQKCKDMDAVLDYIQHWELKRKDLPLDTDGVVIKVNSYAEQRFLGMTAKSPRWATAFKYKPENASTLLKAITYQVGRTGAVTPVAELEEVELSGTKVRRASLHNADEIERLGLHLGDYVFVEKGGEIIPKVTAVDIAKRKTDAPAVVYITHCPDCGTELIRREGEAVHYCPNEKACPPQILGKLEHFVSRNALNIDSVGGKSVEQFYNKGLVRTVADLYTLKYADVISLEGYKEKSAQNVIEGIAKSKEMPFKKVLFALGIRFVGETVAEKLVEHFLTVDKLKAASFEELMKVPEIGERIAQSVLEYFKDPESLKIVDALQAAGLTFEAQASEAKVLTDKLQGASFVISGVFAKYERDQLKDIIIANGGKVSSSVSGKLNYLLAGDGMGPSKLQKAQELGVKIISEADFEAMIA